VRPRIQTPAVLNKKKKREKKNKERKQCISERIYERLAKKINKND
jgi:hypothetical protein